MRSTRPGNRVVPLLLVVLLATMTAACEAIAGIFKAGVGVGVFLAIIVVALVIYVVSRMRA